MNDNGIYSQFKSGYGYILGWLRKIPRNDFYDNGLHYRLKAFSSNTVSRVLAVTSLNYNRNARDRILLKYILNHELIAHLYLGPSEFCNLEFKIIL